MQPDTQITPGSPLDDFINHNQSKHPKRKRLLTIISVSIAAIIVIAILSVVVLRIFGTNTKASGSTQVKDALANIASKMKASRESGGGYPIDVSLLGSFDGVKIIGGGSFDGAKYCVTGTSVSDSTAVFHIDSSNNDPQAGSCSDNSNPAVPSAPGGLGVAFVSPKQLKITWNETPFAESYILQCSTDKAFANSASAESSTASGLCDNLKPNKLYYYRVKAINKSGESSWSSVLSMQTPAK